mgnify:CR=1 FL=1
MHPTPKNGQHKSRIQLWSTNQMDGTQCYIYDSKRIYSNQIRRYRSRNLHWYRRLFLSKTKNILIEFGIPILITMLSN